MDDPGRRPAGNGDELEQATARIRTDHQQAFLTVVLELHQTNRVLPGVRDVIVIYSVPAR